MMEKIQMIRWIMGGLGIAILISATVQNLILSLISQINATTLQWIGVGLIIGAIALGK